MYVVPGMAHCSGGPATDKFDMLPQLVQWVEQGIAPDSVPAAATNPGYFGVARAPARCASARSRPATRAAATSTTPRTSAAADQVRHMPSAAISPTMRTSGGVGNSAHLAGELFKSIAKVDVIHVPYKGSSPALTDVMAGQVNYMLDTGAYGQIKGGKSRAIAVASGKRHPMLPSVPTFEELGIKGMTMNAWYGVAAPAGTPADVVDRVNSAVQAAFRSGDLGKRLAALGAEPRPGDAASFAAFWKSELDRYAGLVKLTGAKLD